MRVLVVDDEDAIRFALGEYLRTHGIEVDEAEELSQALRLVQDTDYDAALVDLRLSGSDSEDGLAIVDALHARQPATPIVLLTAYASVAVESTAAGRGVAAVIQKPCALADLLALLRRLVPPTRP
jgi:DNA-binding response OmpR family regulator